MIFRSSILFGENDIITAHRASVQSIRLACLILDQEFCSGNRVGYDAIADIHTLEKQRQLLLPFKLHLNEVGAT